VKKGQAFQKMVLENWIRTCRRMKLDSYISPVSKNNSKWILHNYKSEMMKLLEGNTGETLHDIGRGKDYLDMTPKKTGSKSKS
jgi:hypothetical protein